MKKRLLTVIAATAAMILAGCGNTTTSSTSAATSVPASTAQASEAPASVAPESSVAPASSAAPVEVTITLDQTEKKCEPGDNFFLKATVTPEGTAVTWTSSDEKIAKVNTVGRVTAVADGVATITATAGGKSATCTVTVKSKEITKINTITGATDDAVVVQGKVAALTTNGYYVWDGTGYMFAYDSTNTPAIGDLIQVSGKIVNYYGTLEFSSPDVTTVTGITVDAEPTPTELTGALVDTISSASTSEFYKYCTLYTWTATAALDGTYTVISPEGTTKKVEPYKAPSSFKFTEGKDYKITAIVNCWNNSSSYLGVALVSIEEVVYEVESVAVTAPEDATSLRVDETLQLTAAQTPAKAETTFTWGTSDPAIATVSETGLVTALKEGEVTITATSANGKSAEYKLTVLEKAKDPVTSISVKNSEGADVTALQLAVGDTSTLVSKVLPETAPANYEYKSSNEDVVKVAQDGSVSAVGFGTADITVTSVGLDADGNAVVVTIPVTVVRTAIKALTTASKNVAIAGTVTGIGYNSFIVDDGTAGIYVYQSSYTVKVGDYVEVLGSAAYKSGGLDIVASKVNPLTGDAPATTTVSELTADNAASILSGIDASTSTPAPLGPKYKLTAENITGSGNYFYWELGATHMECTGYNASVFTTQFEAGKSYDIEGYVYGLYTSNNVNYLTFYVTSIKEAAGIVAISGANTVTIGETATLTATTSMTESDTYTWTSSDETIATVDGGKVTGVAEGKVTITATSASSGKSATYEVEVSAKPIVYTSIKDLTSTSADVNLKGVVVNVVKNGYILDDGTAGVYVFDKTASVKKGDVATVAGSCSYYNGGIEFVPTNTAVIDEEVTPTTAVELTETNAAAILAAIDTTNKVAAPCGTKYSVTTDAVTGSYFNFNLGSVKMTTNSYLADGLTDALVAGHEYNLEGYIFGNSGGSLSFIVTEATEVAGNVFIDGEKSVKLGETLTLTATTSKTESDTYTWTSSDETKATVADGVVTGVAAGTVTITATSATTGKSATITVEVKNDASLIEELDFTKNTQKFKTSYKDSETVNIGTDESPKNIYLSNGAYNSGYGNGGVVMGSNKLANFTGTAHTAVAKALDSTVTADTNTVTVDGTKTSIATLEFQYDYSNVHSYTVNSSGAQTMYSGTTVYILESTDSGATYSAVASKTYNSSDTTPISLTYTRETNAETARYAIALTGDATGSNFKFVVGSVRVTNA